MREVVGLTSDIHSAVSLTTVITAGMGVLAVLCTIDRASGRCDTRAAAKFALRGDWR